MVKCSPGRVTSPRHRARNGVFPFFVEVIPVQDIISIIQSLGFPIACVIAMFCMWQSEVKAHDAEMDKMRDTLEEQSKATVDALNNNTVILNRILERIGEE